MEEMIKLWLEVGPRIILQAITLREAFAPILEHFPAYQMWCVDHVPYIVYDELTLNSVEQVTEMLLDAKACIN